MSSLVWSFAGALIVWLILDSVKAAVNTRLERRYGRNWHKTRHGRLWTSSWPWALGTLMLLLILPPIPFHVFAVCLLLGVVWGASTRFLTNALASVGRLSEFMDRLWSRLPNVPLWAWFGLLVFVVSYYSASPGSRHDEGLAAYHVTMLILGILTLAASRKTPGGHIDSMVKLLMIAPLVTLVKVIFGGDALAEPPGILSGLILGGVASTYAVLWLGHRLDSTVQRA